MNAILIKDKDGKVVNTLIFKSDEKSFEMFDKISRAHGMYFINHEMRFEEHKDWIVDENFSLNYKGVGLYCSITLEKIKNKLIVVDKTNGDTYSLIHNYSEVENDNITPRRIKIDSKMFLN